MAGYFPDNDNTLAAWMGNFNAVAAANLATLGLTDTDLKPNKDAAVAFVNDLTGQVSARAAAVAATTKKNNSRHSVENSTRLLIRRIQANPNVPENLKVQLGITAGTPIPTPISPVPPIDVVVNGYDNGINTLAWKANGNKPGTDYVIEAKIGDASAWQLLNVTTRTKWNHTGQRPGVPATYRICARRGEKLSGCSNEAGVYVNM